MHLLWLLTFFVVVGAGPFMGGYSIGGAQTEGEDVAESVQAADERQQDRDSGPLA